MNSNSPFNFVPHELIQDKHKNVNTFNVNLNINFNKGKKEEKKPEDIKLNQILFSSPVAINNAPRRSSKPQVSIAPKEDKNKQYAQDEILFCSKPVLARMSVNKRSNKRQVEYAHMNNLFSNNVKTNVKIEDNVPNIFAKGETVKKTLWGRYYKLVATENELNDRLGIPQFTTEEIENLWSSTGEKALSQAEAEQVMNIKLAFPGSKIGKRSRSCLKGLSQ